MAVQTVQGPGITPQVRAVEADWLADQIKAALLTGAVAAVKVGALGTAANVRAVVDAMKAFADVPLVVDPVAATSSGATLLDDAGWQVMSEELLPIATIVTPNIPETERLVGAPIASAEAMAKAGRKIADRGPFVLVTGGHLGADERLCDVLVAPPDRMGMPWRSESIASERLELPAKALRGTGCRLSAAIAAHLAWGHAVHDAVVAARHWLQADLAAGRDKHA